MGFHDNFLRGAIGQIQPFGAPQGKLNFQLPSFNPTGFANTVRQQTPQFLANAGNQALQTGLNAGVNRIFGSSGAPTPPSVSGTNTTANLLNTILGINTSGSLVNQNKTQTQTQGGGLGNNFGTLLGLGLIGGSEIGRQEPGFVTESRQALRNLQTPQGFGSQFGATVAPLQQQFQPFFEQRDQRSIADLTQRLKSALPPTVGAQGGEIASVARLLGEELDPARNAFLGQLGLEGLNTQASAARQVLETARPNVFQEALGGLGGSLLLAQALGGVGGGQGGGLSGILGSLFGGGQQQRPGQAQQPGGAGGTGGGGAGGLLGSLLGGGGGAAGSFPSGIIQSLPPALAQNLSTSLASQFGLAGNFGGLEPLGNGLFAVTDTAGTAVGSFNPATGQVTNFTTGQSSPLNLQGGGAGIGGLLQGLGAAAAGGFGGNLIGQQLPGTQLGGSLAGGGFGAASGAAIGAFGGPLGAAAGAAIGGIAGLVGGFFGSKGSSAAEKAANLRADSNAQAGQVRAVFDFFGPRLEAVGGDAGAFTNQFTSAINNIDSPASEQGDLAVTMGNALLEQIRKQDPSITSLDQIPGFRNEIIGFLMQNAQVAPTAGGERGLSKFEAEKLAAKAGIDTSTPGISELNVNQFGPITHSFTNIDRASPADAQAIVGKLRATGYSGPLPASLTTPVGPNSFGGGRVLIQRANRILQLHSQGKTPAQIQAEAPDAFI